MTESFDDIETASYQHSAEGVWGEFSTPNGRVAFLLTKARLGTAGTDQERRLTALLRPVREVLPAGHLDFNQLLQRDLDDHRVAENLIPYLLKPKATGVAFFPPIMAVLLPFTEKKPAGGFPAETFNDVVKDGGLSFKEQRYSHAYRVQRMWRDGKPHPIKLGRVAWNEEFAKLVVLDGQHRAMALLAIDRTINKQWDGAGNRYRHFYEHKVNELLKGAAYDLNNVEIPVTLCWFPDLNGVGKDPHKAARKLFVDVNKEARQPSEARLTLLSDTELLNIFTRSLLNRLRDPNPPLPLTAIEYDNPERDSSRPVRWNAIANLNLLKFAVQRTVFGPQKMFTAMGYWPTGRQPVQEMDDLMRRRLKVADLFPDTIPDGERTIERGKIGNENFPHGQVDKLVAAFRASWGEAILAVLGELLPYKAHWTAAEYIATHWIEDDAFSSLAKEALFGGVGTYWTLRDSFLYWNEECERLREIKAQIPSPPDIVKAWETINKKGNDFEGQRAREYLGKKGEGPEAVARSKEFFDTANTHACQLGALLALATLANACGVEPKDVAAFARRVVVAWNAALESPRTKEESRRLVFARAPVILHPLNRIKKLDTPLAVHFRYFWLELLRLPAAQAALGADGEGTAPVVTPAILNEWAAKARSVYLEYLVSERAKSLADASPDADEKALLVQARKGVTDDVAAAYKHWFDMKKDAAEALITEALASTLPLKGKKPKEALPDPIPDATPTPSPAANLTDILKDLPEAD